MSDSVAQAVVRLFQTERFYAELAAKMRRVSSKSVGTAGVCVKDQIELHINHEWFDARPLDERVAILKHECEHILRDHIARSKELAPDVYTKVKNQDPATAQINSWKHKTINVAADCAINCHVKDLPEGGMYPKNFDLQNGETMEWYLANLKDNEKAKELMEFDGHELWAESESDQEMLREKVRKAISDAASKTRAAGMMTSEQELLVEGWLGAKTLNWAQQLRRFVARSAEVVTESSKKKRNRRYGITFPGHVRKEVLHIGVAMDTSGSMSDEALAQIMAEIHNMSKHAKITVVEADSSIKNTYVYKPNVPRKIKGRGGTAYQPAFDFFNAEGDVDAVIYFGDMDTYDQEELTKPRYPVLWAIIGSQNPPATWGQRIEVKV